MIYTYYYLDRKNERLPDKISFFYNSKSNESVHLEPNYALNATNKSFWLKVL